MLKWLLTFVIAVTVVSFVAPALMRRFGGRLPGDVPVKLRGRTIILPFASTLLLSLVAWGVMRLL